MTPEQQEKLDVICNEEGCDVEELKRKYEDTHATVVPGICMNDGCDYTTGVSGDDFAWCDRCQDHTVMSCLELMNL